MLEISEAFFQTFSGCQAGTEGDGFNCTECQNSYQPGGEAGDVTCTDCPENTFAPDRSTSEADCEGNSRNH